MTVIVGKDKAEAKPNKARRQANKGASAKEAPKDARE